MTALGSKLDMLAGSNWMNVDESRIRRVDGKKKDEFVQATGIDVEDGLRLARSGECQDRRLVT